MKKITKKTTVREILQQVGTEFGRSMANDIWCNTLFSDYKKSSNWVISDMRFENEFEAVKKRGGLCITIQRGKIPKEEHFSEKALDGDRDWNYIINNNGSLEELVEKVREILREAL